MKLLKTLKSYLLKIFNKKDKTNKYEKEIKNEEKEKIITEKDLMEELYESKYGESDKIVIEDAKEFKRLLRLVCPLDKKETYSISVSDNSMDKLFHFNYDLFVSRITKKDWDSMDKNKQKDYIGDNFMIISPEDDSKYVYAVKKQKLSEDDEDIDGIFERTREYLINCIKLFNIAEKYQTWKFDENSHKGIDIVRFCIEIEDLYGDPEQRFSNYPNKHYGISMIITQNNETANGFEGLSRICVDVQQFDKHSKGNTREKIINDYYFGCEVGYKNINTHFVITLETALKLKLWQEVEKVINEMKFTISKSDIKSKLE